MRFLESEDNLHFSALERKPFFSLVLKLRTSKLLENQFWFKEGSKIKREGNEKKL